MLFLCFGDSGDMRFMDYWLFFALLFLFVSIFFFLTVGLCPFSMWAYGAFACFR